MGILLCLLFEIFYILQIQKRIVSAETIRGNTVYVLVTATLSGMLKPKQKLGRTFNSDKLGGIDF